METVSLLLDDTMQTIAVAENQLAAQKILTDHGKKIERVELFELDSIRKSKFENILCRKLVTSSRIEYRKPSAGSGGIPTEWDSPLQRMYIFEVIPNGLLM